MAGTRTGSSTIIQLAKHMCRVFRKFHASDLASLASPEVAAAVLTLVTACEAWELADDYPGQIDKTGPHEDIDL